MINKLRTTENPLMAPHPVHPRAVRNHGLFGISFVRQHMMVDERWTPTSLTEEFHGMADLLSKRLIFKRLEAKATRKCYVKMNRNLRQQCRDGRLKLQKSLWGDNTKAIRNFLINHTDMQRLYQKLPIQLVQENINQRTFVMRKERDRLGFRLDQLKEIYRKKLLERATLENRIRYQNEFELEEEAKTREFRKKIENSNVRLKAIKTINGTYKKMIQILRHDGIFYEPILRSLSSDIDDQSQFIKHVLFLGMPAIYKFKELNEEYRQMEDKVQKSMQVKLGFVQLRRASVQQRMDAKSKPGVEGKMPFNRYMRETPSMNKLIDELEKINTTIKQIKFATLCSQATEIFPRIKGQVENNKILHKKIVNDNLTHENLQTRMKRADVLEGVLINNLAEDEIKRLERIRELQALIASEDEFEETNMQHMKERAKYYVILRYSLWNLHDILQWVDRPSKVQKINYPISYLKLPLLKFEMLTMRAYPPNLYDENVDNIIAAVKRKMTTLIGAYTSDVSVEEEENCIDSYHKEFLDVLDINELHVNDTVRPQNEEDDYQLDTKLMQQVPNRKTIKAQSAKLVEEMLKKDD